MVVQKVRKWLQKNAENRAGISSTCAHRNSQKRCKIFDGIQCSEPPGTQECYVEIVGSAVL